MDPHCEEDTYSSGERLESPRHTAHLREDKASQDEVRRRPALYVYRYEPVWRAEVYSQFPLHTFLQHPHLRLQDISRSFLMDFLSLHAVDRAALGKSTSPCLSLLPEGVASALGGGGGGGGRHTESKRCPN